MKRDTRYYQQHGLLRIFLSYFGPHRRLFLLDMLCALFIGAVDLIFPLISRRAINTMLPAHAYHTFFVVMGIMAAAYLVRAFFYYIIAYYGHTFGIRVEADIRRDLFRHMQSLGYEFYDHNRTGQLMSRLTTDLFEITELAHHGPEDIFISMVTIAGALAMEPELIIMDEATAMLDPSGRAEVLATVRKLNREKGMTVVWITHFMEEAAVADSEPPVTLSFKLSLYCEIPYSSGVTIFST